MRSRVTNAAPKGCRSASMFDDDEKGMQQRTDLESGAEKKAFWSPGRGTSGGGKRSKDDGVTVSMTSKIEVEEGKGLDEFGNSNAQEDRIGNFVVRNLMLFCRHQAPHRLAG